MSNFNYYGDHRVHVTDHWYDSINEKTMRLTADFDLGDGDSILFVSRVIPDFTINSGSVDITLKTRKFAQSSQVSEVVGNVTATTENINTRVRGRQASLRIENSNLNDSWEYGATRIDMRPDGRR